MFIKEIPRIKKVKQNNTLLVKFGSVEFEITQTVNTVFYQKRLPLFGSMTDTCHFLESEFTKLDLITDILFC